MISTACRLPDGRLLTASDHGFAVWDGDVKRLSATFDQVVRALAWQRDMATYDHVYVEITLTGGDTLLVDEDVRGFRHLMDRLATLPGFDRDWWEKVILPPGASNQIVAYERAESSEAS